MRTALAACWLSMAALTPEVVLAQAFFSRPELDFWNEARPSSESEAPQEPTRPLDAGEFRWEDYDDPTKDVFWDDGGNYLPPRPLRMAAANPTPANVANYLRWQRRKMEVVAALTREVQRQSAAGQGPMAPPSVTSVSVTPPEADAIRENGEPIDWRRLELVFFYRSDCSHCQASLATVQELEARGAKVIPVQVDWRARPPLIPGSVHYTKEISQEQPIDAVPTWIASYQGERLNMQGNVTVQSIEVTLKMAQQQRASLQTQTTNGGRDHE